MTRFTIRVVLYDANLSHYHKLYTEMAKYGFTDEIMGDDGQVYKMAPGDYDFAGNWTSVEVRSIASTAAAAAGSKYAVFVTEVVSRAWLGLPLVRARTAA